MSKDFTNNTHEVLTGPIVKRMKRLARGIRNGSVSVLIADGRVVGVERSMLYGSRPSIPALSRTLEEEEKKEHG